MKSFIIEHLEEILVEWESFARSLLPASATMDSLALRIHAQQMLEAIAKDLGTPQSDHQQALKSRGLGPVFEGVQTAAAAHGALRHAVGFDLRQLVAEFRALRASVLRLWLATKQKRGRPNIDLVRFNEAVDQALAESIATYSDELLTARETFLSRLGKDLRHPLTAMSGALDTFSASGDDANRAEAFAVGTRSVNSISGLIRDMSEYTRTQLEKGVSILLGDGNLELVCKSAIREVSLAYPQTSFRFESGGRLDGIFDTERVHQLVSNLLDHAVRRGHPGSPISLIVHGDEDVLRVSVTNVGVRIAAAPMHPHVDARSFANLGIAIFVARQIVLAHGGTIQAASAGTGTTYTVVLPRAATALGSNASIRSLELHVDAAGTRAIH